MLVREQKRKVLVEALLETDEKEKLVEFLKNNQDVFAWSHKDMPRIDPITCVMN